MTTRARVQANPTTLILSDFMGELSSRIAAWSSVGFGKSERKELPEKAAVSGQYQRSEEHTSELQSRLHLVCRLLLEKKKKLRGVSNYVDSTIVDMKLRNYDLI